MIQMFGLSSKEKKPGYRQTVTCSCCGSIASAEIVITYNCITFIGMEIYKFSKHYFVQMSCCGAYCEIDKKSGRAAERGRPVLLDAKGMLFTGSRCTSPTVRQSRCPRCGYVLNDSSNFCPSCGQKIN